MTRKVLFLLGDCPGNYVPLMHSLARKLVTAGTEVVMASTTPYYERYTGVSFSELGEAYYLSKFLENDFSGVDFDEVDINYWHTYPTYIRDHYFIGRHRNDWREYKKVVLFYEKLFDDNSFDLVISEPPSNAFLYIGYSAAERTKTEFIGFISARIPNHINIFQNAYGESLLHNSAYESNLPNFRSGPPDYMLKQKSKKIRGGGGSQFWNFIRYSLSNSIETSSTPIHQLRAFYKKYIWRKLRYLRVRLASIFVDDFPDDQKINVFFPLHLRPEASTSVLARYYEDDLELLKNIAFSMPRSMRLIVKEHRPAMGIRNLAFYRKVLSFPNTVLLTPDFDFRSQVHRLDAVIVLSSTVGFEALQAGVPVLLLGRTFYSDYRGVTRIESFAELEGALSTLKKNNAQADETIMQKYLTTCFSGQFNYMDDDVLSDENIENLMVPILQVLEGKQA